jgi:hypothetical protein
MKQEALTLSGKKLLSKLLGFPQFYLAGGTALALQLGHRVSVDFDFFSAEPVKKEFLESFYKIFAQNQVKEIFNTPQEFSVLADEVKITFLHYPFPLIDGLIKDGGLSMASIREIGAMKAYTIGRRAELKDYVDMRAVLFSGIHLNQICEDAENKFGENFSRKMFLQQLVYLDDVEDQVIQFLDERIEKKDLADFFSKQVEKVKL